MGVGIEREFAKQELRLFFGKASRQRFGEKIFVHAGIVSWNTVSGDVSSLTPSQKTAILPGMTYPGGKAGAGVYQTLINLMPPHDVYVEPFLGAGAILRMKRPAALNIGIDLDPEVIRAWDAAAAAKTALTNPRAKSSGERRRRSANPAILPDESPEMKSSAEIPENGDKRSLPAETGERRQYLELASLRLPSGPGQFQFGKRDGIAALRDFQSDGRTVLIYCDPPYLHSTRGRAGQYAFEMTDAQHLEILSLIKELPCMVMISGYSSPMYAKALKGWNATSFQAATRGKPAAEWVWYNYDKPVELHDYRFLGNDFRERERIKRKMMRWTERLKRQPLLERQALLAAIAATASDEGLQRRK